MKINRSIFFALSIGISLAAMEKPTSSDFLDAVRNGDTPRLRELLNADKVENKTVQGALFRAIRLNYSSSYRLLISEPKIDVNVRTRAGHSLIFFAAFHNNSTAVSLLLDRKDLDLSKQEEDPSLLDMVIMQEIDHLIEKIIKKGGPAYVEKHGKKALTVATMNDKPEAVKILLAHGINPNNGCTLDKTPLHRAVSQNLLAMAGVLVNSGSDVNKTDNNGYSPLFIAASRNNYDMAALLVSRGASITQAIAVAQTLHDDRCILQINEWFCPAEKKADPRVKNRNRR